MTEASQEYIEEQLQSLRKKLLDLTGKNRLLNFKHSKTGTLRVVDELPNQLCEALFSEKEMSFAPVPQPTEAELIEAGFLEYDDEGTLRRLRSQPDAPQWAKAIGINDSYELPDDDDGESKHHDLSIQTLLYPEELEARLRNLNSKSKLAIDETGANVLYLAFGFLEWYETVGSEEQRLAPLFLVPVLLQRGKLDETTETYHYSLTYSGEDVVTNISLAEKLRQDLNINLPDVEDQMLPDEYLAKVNAMIKKAKKDRWKVHRYCTLTLLNFSKLLMYLDLDPKRWPTDERNITNHPLIRQFFGASEIKESAGFQAEYNIDEIENINDEFPLIDDADSSQHSALIDAIKGKNLIIEGPPGTGKSQTITNLIAAALGQGKSVLFVAEKLAALEVVKRRLDKASLGDFCLELHSHKTQKRDAGRPPATNKARIPRGIELAR